MSPKPEIFHKGETVQRKTGDTQEEIAVSEKARLELEKLFRAVEEEGKTPYLSFDWDGTLLPYGIESGFNRQTVAEYLGAHPDMVGVFRRRISHLREFGFRVAVNTGRSVRFVQTAAPHLFPSGSLDAIIGENGVVFARREGLNDATRAEIRTAPYLTEEKIGAFRAQCDNIIRLCERMGWHVEDQGKLIGVVLFPNDINLDNDARAELCRKTEEAIKRASLDHGIEIHYSGAIDIAPLGVTKVFAAQEVFGANAVLAHFGDTSSDEEAMRAAAVGVAPANAAESTKKVARSATIGLTAGRNDLEGVIDGLSVIEAYIRARNIRNIKRGKTGAA